jgi:hypothetical protein
MSDELDKKQTAAKAALEGLVSSIARASAQASERLGVEFDVDDPRVARWLMLATFEGLLMPPAKRTTEELLVLAEKASEGQGRTSSRKGKRERKLPLVTWDDLVGSQHSDKA